MNDTKTVSGNIVHIQDKGAPTALSVIANITPKQSGTGTPSPENVRQISGWESVNVFDAGVNVWDEEWEQGTYSTADGGKIGTSNYWRNKNPILVKPSETYYFHTSGDYLYRFFYDNNKQFVGYLAGIADASYQIPANVYYLNIVDVSRNTYDPSEKPISINYPSTDHDYHAYTGTTTTTSLGRTVYGGTLDVVTGVLTVTHGIIDLGAYTWQRNSTYTNCYSIGGNSLPIPAPINVCHSGLCEKYNVWYTGSDVPLSTITSSSSNGNVFISPSRWSSSNKSIVINDNRGLSADAFTNDLSGTHLVCELATPQTYTLTGQNVALLKDCYAWADSGDISITYETYLINGLFHKIWINGVKMFAPNDFTLERSDVYAGEITTCTGKIIADRIGWKYADMSLNWDYLPQEYLETILNLSGVFTITFENEEGVQFTEQCIRKGSTMTGTRYTDNDGNMMWKGVQFDISFINVHN